MQFSILIPVYNVQKYLGACLDSILNQDFSDYEIVIVDDGSTDLSPGICDKYCKNYPGRIRVIHKNNEGLLLARRTAIDNALGEYLVFVDSDDLLPPNTLSRYNKCIVQFHPDMIYTDIYRLHDDGEIEEWPKLSGVPGAPESNRLCNDISIFKELTLNQMLCCWSMWQKCVKRDMVKTTFDFRKLAGLQHGEDTLQSIVIFNNIKNFVYLDGCFYEYRVGSGMTAVPSFKKIEDFYIVTEFIKDNCKLWAKDIKGAADVFLMLYIIEFIVGKFYSNEYNYYHFQNDIYAILHYQNIENILHNAGLEKNSYLQQVQALALPKELNKRKIIIRERFLYNDLLVTEKIHLLFLILKLRKKLKK